MVNTSASEAEVPSSSLGSPTKVSNNTERIGSTPLV